jgi:xanthine phosphoribosyltransferase
MRELAERIEREGLYVGGGIVKVDAFLNHQVDGGLMRRIGREFAYLFAEAGVTGVTKVLTAESSGIPPALCTAQELDVPLIYARKKTPLTMSKQVYYAEAPSRTKGGIVPLMVSPDYLGPADVVLIIDDFLATGETLLAVLDIVRQSGARLAGVGCVVEKLFEPGRTAVTAVVPHVPIFSLAQIDLVAGVLRITG